MRVFDNGAFYTVTVDRWEVENFASRWPCSGLRWKPVTFTFEKSNGDLVDSNDSTNHPDADGAAILALSHDAGNYGARRLRLPEHCFR